MVADSEGHSESFEESGRPARFRCASRPFRLAGLVALAAGLVTLAPASALGATTFVHSAKSGELAGGRLTLHGVGPEVTWTTTAGRRASRPSRGPSLASCSRPRRRPPERSTSPAIRGGDEPTFKLSRPRYNAPRQTVSYRAKLRSTTSPCPAAPRVRGEGRRRVARGPRRYRSSRTRRGPTASTATRRL